jgi:predicted permease
MRLIRWWDHALLDARFALRMLRRSPGFSATAVLTLALGVGSTTAIFSVVKAVVLNQLPYRDPERVVALAQAGPDTQKRDNVSARTAIEWRSRSRSLESLSLYGDGQGTLVENDEAEVLRGLRVSFEFFETLGASVARGRTFLPEEDRAPRANVVILTHDLWLRRFGGNPDIVGRLLQLNAQAYRVIGVLPADFHPLRMSNPAETPQIFMPLGYDLKAAAACPGCEAKAIGRLRNGVSVDAARTELTGILQQVAREYPAEYARDALARVAPLRDQLIGPVRNVLWMLMAAVALVLLIACANVSNMILARASARSKELALRAALGGQRWRLARQLLTESLLLSVIGGTGGVLLAWWGTSALASFAPKELPRLDEIRVDQPVLLFGLGISIATGVLFGVAPAWRASRVDVNDALKRDVAAGSSGSGHAGHRLVVAEIALAFVLVLGAGLLGRSFLRLTAVDLGFDPHHVLTFTPVFTPSTRFREPLLYNRQLVDGVRRIPGITSAGMVSNVPLSRSERFTLRVEGQPELTDSETGRADVFWTSPDYFTVLKIPLVRGRWFTDRDGAESPPAAIVSESLARSRFPASNALGRRVQVGRWSWATIVGVAGDVRHDGLDLPPNQAVYLPQAMNPFHYTRLVARTVGDPLSAERAVRAAVKEIDPLQALFHVQAMDDYISSSLADRTFTLTLTGLFGTLALLLATVGVYGVIAYAVALRTREMGIRIALGARRRSIVGMVLRDVVLLLAWGFAVGVVAAFALTRLISHTLYLVQPHDVTTTAVVGLTLSCVAILAGAVPALRAARVEPMLALRSD